MGALFSLLSHYSTHCTLEIILQVSPVDLLVSLYVKVVTFKRTEGGSRKITRLLLTL